MPKTGLSWFRASRRTPSYDLIIYGAGVRMSAMRGFRFPKQLKAAGPRIREVIVWASGGTTNPGVTGRFCDTYQGGAAKSRYLLFYFEGGGDTVSSRRVPAAQDLFQTGPEVPPPRSGQPPLLTRSRRIRSSSAMPLRRLS